MSDLEQRWRELGAFIREQRRNAQISLRKLSEQAGVSNPYLSQIERGLRRPSAEILQQIARALEISAETLYVQAGILEPRSAEVDVVGEIRRDPALSPDQKKTLVHIYETFRAERAGSDGASDDGPDGGASVSGTGESTPDARGETHVGPVTGDVDRAAGEPVVQGSR